MKQLLILRHAKSSWKHAGLTDHDRPLNPRGLRDAPRMGRLLLSRDLLPQRILCSTAVRAHTTALMVCEAAGLADPPEFLRELYLAAPTSYIEHLALLDDDDQRVMVVGHNPGLEELVYLLTRDHETMSTAALAHVALPIERWAEVSLRTRGTLLDLWRPRDLEGDAPG